MSVLIVGEVVDDALHPATPCAVAAAQRLGQDIHLVLAARPQEAVVMAAASLADVTRVRCLGAAHYRDQGVENLALPLAQMASSYSHIVCAATVFGQALALRLAAMLDVAPVVGVRRILAPDVFQCATPGGNADQRIACPEPLKVLTICPSVFLPIRSGPALALIDEAPTGPDFGVSKRIGRHLRDPGAGALEQARIIVTGGLGLSCGEHFRQWIVPLAQQLGAAVGATSAAVAAGFAPPDCQIGLAGQRLAPELYIAIGASGSPAHLAAIAEARVVVALNCDAHAPIVRRADYHLMGDLAQLMPRMLAGLPAL